MEATSRKWTALAGHGKTKREMNATNERSAVPWGILLVLAAAWFGGVRLLSPQWTVYEEYQYGWAVPFLCLYLLHRRWLDRPAPAAGTLRPVFLVTLALGACLLLPIRIIVEANLIWRLGSWALAGALVIVTLAVIGLAGGKPWLKHFGFAVAFFLVAIPWPSRWEKALVHGLMPLNTEIVVELLSLLGIPALQHGNVIEVSQGMVGVDEACSGIRSLQATFMLALFFGEYYRLSRRRRIGLIAAGAGIALLCNLVRTFLLVWVTSRSGLAAMEKWHDPTGIGILLVCFCGTWFLSTRLRLATLGGDVAPTPRRVVPRSLAVMLGTWLALLEITNAVWFHLRGDARTDLQNWSVRWPETRPQFREITLSPRVLAVLNFQEGRSVGWVDPDGSVWQAFHFRWGPATSLLERTRVNLAKTHKPDDCLPASGKTLVAARGVKQFAVNGLKLPCQAFEFSDQGRPLFVYYCAWEDGTRGGEAEFRESTTARLRAAWLGNRTIGQRVLEVAMWGKSSAERADEAVARLLPEIITTH